MAAGETGTRAEVSCVSEIQAGVQDSGLTQPKSLRTTGELAGWYECGLEGETA